MKEKAIVVRGRKSGASGRGGRQAKAPVSFEDPRFHCDSVPATGDVPEEELDAHVVVVFWLAVLPAVVVNQTKNDTFHHSWGMIGGRHYILVEVELLLEGLGDDVAVSIRNGEAEKVDGVGEGFKFPSQDSKVVGFGFEIGPGGVCANPYPKHVVYIAFEEKEVVAESWNQRLDFVDSKVYSGPHTGC